MTREMRRGLAVVRGAGDLATGTILRLLRSGFRVIALELDAPLAIRRTVAFSEAVYQKSVLVEGQRAALVASAAEALALAEAEGRQETVPILLDPGMRALSDLAPEILIDAILAKRNLGTTADLATIVVALGPGFRVPEDAHAVVETSRGHYLGRVIRSGGALPDTGIPGLVGGKSAERVVHLPVGGRVQGIRCIGDQVECGEPILKVVGNGDSEDRETLVPAPLTGILRGLIRPGVWLPAGVKVADVDPRGVREHCFSVSDKAFAVAGGVLEAVLSLGGRPA